MGKEQKKEDIEIEIEKESEIKADDSEKALNDVAENLSPVNPDVFNRDKKENSAESNIPDPDSYQKPHGRLRKPVKGVTDKRGNPFNEDLHESDENGTPIINKKDGFLKMKPGRPKATKKTQSKPFQNKKGASSPQPKIESVEDVQHRRYISEISATGFIKLGLLIFGEEWLPRKDEKIDEHGELCMQFERYYSVKGVSDIPPGAALAIGLGSYALVRLHLPKTRSGFGKLWDGFKLRIYKLFNYIKKNRRKSNASQSDTGNDGKREDDTSAEVSE